MRNEFEIIPINSDDSPDKWDLTRLPEVARTFKGMKQEEYEGENDIKALIQGFSQYLDISKRVNSMNTRRNYIWNTKQFLLWCNSMDYNIKRVENTQELRNLAIVYNKVLLQSDIQQNTVALKMQSIRKFL